MFQMQLTFFIKVFILLSSIQRKSRTDDVFVSTTLLA